MKKHPYHILELSPWPILVSFSLLFLLSGAVVMMHYDGSLFKISAGVSFFGFAGLIYSVYGWWSDVVHEAREEKAHNNVVALGLKIGFVLFIISEVWFFGAFFASFFRFSLSPVGLLEGVWANVPGIWPPEGIKTFDPWHLPFLNTLILLLSGTTVTWAHYEIIENNQKESVKALIATVALGFIFTCLQAFEYMHAPFKFTDGIYAANFYMATGFHGAHVIIGTIFLLVCLIRAQKGHFSNGQNHLGFEFAAWYWHFVDIVWLFLFVFVYIFGR